MAHNAALSGSPSFVSGQFSDALSLNGSTQYATLGVLADLSALSAWTVECWVKTTASGTHLAWAYNAADFAAHSFWLGCNGGKAQFNAGASSSVTTTTTINDGAWHHLAVVVSSNTSAVLYVDGASAGSGSISYTPGGGTHYLGFWTSTANYWLGQIDEAAFSGVAQYSGAFSAPAAPFSPTRSGQSALYHCDSATTSGATMLDCNGAALALSPTTGGANASTALTLTGTATQWTTVSPTFSLSGGTGAALGSPSVSSDTAATATLTAGSAPGTLTLTDLSSGASTTFVVATTVATDDANWFFSPANWYLSGSAYAQTACPGAYCKVNFTGTSAALALDTTPLVSAGVSAGLYPKVRYSLDNGPFTDVQLASGANVTVAAPAVLSAGTHTLEAHLLATDNTVDAWTTPSGVWRITGLLVDPGAASAAPPLLSKRALFFGDSITEGAAALAAGSVIASNDSTLAFGRLAATALGAEYGVIAFQQQGYSAATSTGRHVPALYTTGNDASTAWNKHFAGQSRLVAGLLSPAPDYIVCVHGVNDAGLDGATVQAAVQAWLGAVRTAAPLAWLIVVIPFGGFTRTRITAGFTAYVAATADGRAVLLDFGDQTGLTVNTGVANRVSFDGVHPRSTFHAVLGAMLAQGVQRTTVAVAAQPLRLRRRVV